MRGVGIAVVVMLAGGCFSCRDIPDAERVPGDLAEGSLGVTTDGVSLQFDDGETFVLEWLGRSRSTEGGGAVGDTGAAAILETGLGTVKMEVFRSMGGRLWVIRAKTLKPGDLEFRVGLGWAARNEGRRKIVSGEVRAWVFPMESDVEMVNGGIEVRGEGEALIVVGRGGGAEAAMDQLGVKEDRVDDVMRLASDLTAAALQSEYRPAGGF